MKLFQKVAVLASTIVSLTLFAEAQAQLPEGPGRELLQSACVSCHNLDPVTQKRATREEWIATIARMEGLGANLGFTAQQRTTLVDYLVVNLGRGPNLPTPAVNEELPALDVRTVLNNALSAMAAANVNTIQFSGMGSANASLGQQRNPESPWPLIRVKAYTRELDFNALASRVQRTVVQANGAEQVQNPQIIAPNADWGQQYDMWLMPIGFLKGALAASNATVERQTDAGDRYYVVTFTVQGRYRVRGYIDRQAVLRKTETWIDNTVLGDMLVEAVFQDWKDYNGMRFPGMIIQKAGGFPTLILAVNEVRPNVAVNIQPPQQAQGGGGGQQMSNVMSEEVADGVFYIRGINHHSVAVEFADHIAVIEAPQNEARSLAVIAEAKRLIPNKPIRYVINTHHHFDHSGGLRTYVDEGAIVVTHEINRDFYERAFQAPRTINPDRLSQSGRAAQIESVGDKEVLTDGTRILELHLIQNNAHNDGMLVAYLKNEKILIEVDMFTPPAANAQPPAAGTPPNPNAVALATNLEQLQLDFERILALHGPGVVDRAALYRFIGKEMPPITPAATPAAGQQ